MLSLNDDCLFEIFEYLNVVDLCTVADVCDRLKQSAQVYFSRFIKNLDLRQNMFHRPDFPGWKFLIMPDILRNFGAGIEKFADRSARKYQKETLALLSSQYDEVLTHLTLSEYDMTDEVAWIIRPLLQRLQTLSINFSFGFSKLLLESLADWAPELRELEFGYVSDSFHVYEAQYDGLHRSFSKLEKISFLYNHFVRTEDIYEILMRNPQLKQVEIFRCKHVNHCILPVIAEHAPQIEHLMFVEDDSSPINSACFGQFLNLNSLSLSCTNNILSVLREIGLTNMPLRHLRLYDLNLYNDRMADRFADEISKLTKLEKLDLLLARELNAVHILKICRNLTEIAEIYLEADFSMNAADLLNLIRNAKKLKMLALFNVNHSSDDGILIDDSVYQQMVDAVQKRNSQTPLQMRLDSDTYTSQVTPALATLHKKLLTIECMNATSYQKCNNKDFVFHYRGAH